MQLDDVSYGWFWFLTENNKPSAPDFIITDGGDLITDDSDNVLITG